MKPHFVGAGENVHQVRHQAFDGVGDVGRHRARAAVLRRHVLAHIAKIIVHGIGALFREPGGGDRGKRVGFFGGKHGLEIADRHFWHFS